MTHFVSVRAKSKKQVLRRACPFGFAERVPKRAPQDDNRFEWAATLSGRQFHSSADRRSQRAKNFLPLLCSFASGYVGAGVEEGLEDQDGGYLVDYCFAARAEFGGVEVAVGFGGEAFVDEVNGEGEFVAEEFGEGGGFGGLWAEVSGHVEWVADYDFGDFVFAD
jgi:hypothetical protein